MVGEEEESWNEFVKRNIRNVIIVIILDGFVMLLMFSIIFIVIGI
jgi:hypothetical protein